MSVESETLGEDVASAESNAMMADAVVPDESFPPKPVENETPAARVAIPLDSPLAKIKFEHEVFAMADGPCVLCLSMTNTGESPVHLMGWSDEAILASLLESFWMRRERWWMENGSAGPGMKFYTIRPQETYRKLFHLHRDYLITPKSAEIQIDAKFRQEHSTRGRGDVVIDFSRRITITPDADTPASREKIVARLIEYGQSLLTEQRLEFYVNCVLNTDIKELLPLALDASRKAGVNDTRRLVWWMMKTLPNDEFWRVFETEGISAASANSSVWLDALEHGKNKHPVGEAQYQMMRATPNLFARLAAAYFFPKCFAPAELKLLLAEAEKWKPPVTPDELKSDVQLLGSKSYRQREEAAARLRSFGERGVAPLSKLLESAADPEVRERLEAIVEHGKTVRPSLAEVWFFWDLAVRTDNRRLRVGILKALAKNDPASLIAKQAEDALESLAKQEKRRAEEQNPARALKPDPGPLPSLLPSPVPSRE